MDICLFCTLCNLIPSGILILPPYVNELCLLSYIILHQSADDYVNALSDSLGSSVSEKPARIQPKCATLPD